MPPLVDYFILRSQTDGPFALNGTGSIYAAFRVSALPPRSLPFREIRHTPLLFRLHTKAQDAPPERTQCGPKAAQQGW